MHFICGKGKATGTSKYLVIRGFELTKSPFDLNREIQQARAQKKISPLPENWWSARSDGPRGLLRILVFNEMDVTNLAAVGTPGSSSLGGSSMYLGLDKGQSEGECEEGIV